LATKSIPRAYRATLVYARGRQLLFELRSGAEQFPEIGPIDMFSPNRRPSCSSLTGLEIEFAQFDKLKFHRSCFGEGRCGLGSREFLQGLPQTKQTQPKIPLPARTPPKNGETSV